MLEWAMIIPQRRQSFRTRISAPQVRLMKRRPRRSFPPGRGMTMPVPWPGGLSAPASMTKPPPSRCLTSPTTSITRSEKSTPTRSDFA